MGGNGGRGGEGLCIKWVKCVQHVSHIYSFSHFLMHWPCFILLSSSRAIHLMIWSRSFDHCITDNGHGAAVQKLEGKKNLIYFNSCFIDCSSHGYSSHFWPVADAWQRIIQLFFIYRIFDFPFFKSKKKNRGFLSLIVFEIISPLVVVTKHSHRGCA